MRKRSKGQKPLPERAKLPLDLGLENQEGQAELATTQKGFDGRNQERYDPHNRGKADRAGLPCNLDTPTERDRLLDRLAKLLLSDL